MRRRQCRSCPGSRKTVLFVPSMIKALYPKYLSLINQESNLCAGPRLATIAALMPGQRVIPEAEGDRAWPQRSAGQQSSVDVFHVAVAFFRRPPLKKIKIKDMATTTPSPAVLKVA